MPNREDAKQSDLLTTTIAVRRETYERFRKIAEQNNRTPRQEVRALIEQHVRENEKAAV